MARFAALLIFTAIILSACQDSSSTNSPVLSTLAQAKASGTIRVGYANEAPYAYYDPELGQLTGEAPSIARRVFQDMGIKNIEGVLTEFGSLIPGLQAKRFDVIAAGMYITPERCLEAAFSNPTYRIGEGFIVKKGNAKNLHSYEDVAKNDSVKLGVVAGTVELNYATALGVPRDRIKIFPDDLGALAGLQAGRVDAYAATHLTIQTLLEKANDADIERAEPFQDPVINGEPVYGYGAFALRKEDGELIAAVNEGLAKFLGSPDHLKLVQPFGFSKSTLPGSVTADALCASGAASDNG
ncbi:MAG: ectoine/hydroxyectoine ABC transporter substrate-binding protein EhuB [Candidatus Nitrohelix vancouverensis]|uniref:Ectoine/hydroxyectoine ABC transporter substrate-binding protein EhuB n=1 Tax=Candidatus Nitrohelix vancouverensis TaxID=2705534 RepID=A0A7T0G2K6_9BACT|nr:MAG: ectoine/hydroxyectoine ABC transporter substrate-binding protein EhuB [Candidatus Nitrohelix vancouverensis]